MSIFAAFVVAVIAAYYTITHWQGDQSGRIFAQSSIVYYIWPVCLKITEVAHNFCSTFS
jgi:hypothetical protein